MLNNVTAVILRIIVPCALNTLLLSTLAEINEQKMKFNLVFIVNEITGKKVFFSEIKLFFPKNELVKYKFLVL